MKEILLVFSSHIFLVKAFFSVKSFNDLKVYFLFTNNSPTKVNDPGQCVT